MGLTFKEDCNDLRNSKIVDIIYYLNKKNIYKLYFHDPHLDYKNIFIDNLCIYNQQIYKLKKTDLLIVGVAHNIFKKLNNKNILNLIKPNGILFDIKNIYKKRNFINLNKIKYFCL